MMRDKSLLALLLLIVVLVLLGWRLDRHLSAVEGRLLQRAPTAPPLRTLPAGPSGAARGHTLYVPVYSHVYSGQGREEALEVTLSLRNTDSEHPIVIDSIRYYGNEGTLLREYLDGPILLDPLASTDFLVERRDRSGGVGANFLVEWSAEETVTAPLVEAVMVGVEGSRAFAFARPGIPLRKETAESSN
jgi:hypothetical protein